MFFRDCESVVNAGILQAVIEQLLDDLNQGKSLEDVLTSIYKNLLGHRSVQSDRRGHA